MLYDHTAIINYDHKPSRMWFNDTPTARKIPGTILSSARHGPKDHHGDRGSQRFHRVSSAWAARSSGPERARDATSKANIMPADGSSSQDVSPSQVPSQCVSQSNPPNPQPKP